MSTQESFNSFVKLGSSERWNVITKYLDLNVISELYQQSNFDLKKYKVLYKDNPKQDWDKIKGDIQDKINNVNDEINSLTNELEKKNVELEELRKEYYRLENLNNSKDFKFDINFIKNKLLQLNQQIDVIINKINNLNNELIDFNYKLTKINDTLSKYDIDELRNELQRLEDINSSISKVKVDWDYANITLNKYKKSLKLLDSIPCENKYPHCKFIKDANDDKDNYDDQIEKVNKIKNSLEKLYTEFDEEQIPNLKKKIKSIEAIEKQKYDILIKIEKSGGQFNVLQEKKDNLELEIKENENLINNYNKCISQDQQNLLNDLNNQILEIKKKLKEIDNQKIELAGHKGTLLCTLKSTNEMQDKHEKIAKLLKLHETINFALSKKGIVKFIIETKLPKINQEIFQLLNNIVDFTIKLKITGNDKLGIFISYPDKEYPIELGSGMEKLFTTIVMRVAISNISNMPKSNIMFIDEGFGSLDHDQINACGRLLKNLLFYYKNIIIISHVDAMKDNVDTIIEIQKFNNESIINYN
jgi:exonuclease SbcC